MSGPWMAFSDGANTGDPGVTLKRLLSFPDPVNEISARTVAAGAVVLGVATIELGQPWLLVVLAYGLRGGS